MKKIILFFFCLLFSYMHSFSQMTQVGAGPWQAYQIAGAPPAGWQTSCTTANWGNSVAGVLANGTGQANCANNNAYSTTATRAANFIWGPAAVGNTAYFKYCLNLDSSNGCGNYQLIHNVDDRSIIWVNGTQVDAHNGYACNLHGNIDISPWLQCGENVIAVQAINTGGPRFFLAELQYFGFSPNPLALTSDVPDCNDPTIQLSSNISGGNHSWTGPNGFTSNQTNPVINPANSNHEGWYTCTVSLAPCCIQTKSIYVTIPEDCCDETIIVDRNNCFDFNFSLSDDTVDKGCMIWKEDGQVVGTGNTYSNTLYGTHTICVNYLGTQKDNPNEVCCEERCITVTTPLISPAPTYDTIYTCNDHYWYKPESCLDFDSYVITDLDPSDNNSGYNFNYNSATNPTYGGPGCDGWIHHRLIHGTYIFDFYDKNGCLQKTLNLTIAQGSPVVHYRDYVLCEEDCVVFDVNAPDFPCSPNNGILWGYTDILGYTGSPTITICYETAYRFETTTADGCPCIIEGNISFSPPPVLETVHFTWCLGHEELDLSTLFDPCNGVVTETWEDMTASIYAPPAPIVLLNGPIIFQDNGNIFAYGDELQYRYRAYDENGCLICEYIIVIKQGLHAQEGGSEQRISQEKEGVQTIKIFPNPNTGLFNVQFSGVIEEGDWLKVFDVKGQLIQSHPLQTRQEMDISEYSDGLYFLHYGNDRLSEIKEVILQKDGE